MKMVLSMLLPPLKQYNNHGQDRILEKALNFLSRKVLN